VYPELIEAWQKLKDIHGVCVLNHTWAAEHNQGTLSQKTSNAKLAFKDIALQLGCLDAYEQQVKLS